MTEASLTEPRRYNSAKREAQAAATKEAILAAFADQLADPSRGALSPSAAALAAGVSVRTVHSYFPNADSQIVALGEWFDRRFHPGGVRIVEGPDDLVRYFRDIHANALAQPISRALASNPNPVWQEIRQRRRADRLDSIRRALAAIGAPKRDTENATAILLQMAGADFSFPLADTYGLAIKRVPDAIAHTVQLIVDDLRAKAAHR